MSYRLVCPADEAERRARAIAWEQTVELPEGQVDDPLVLEHVVGRVEAIVPDSAQPGAFIATIAYREELASGQLPQLLNLLYGNASIFPGVRVVDLQLPPGLLARFAGPRYGVAGLRAMTGVHGRPLLATALKPRGLTVERLAQMAHDFAAGGGDIVKDDQNLAEPDFVSFRTRVTACAEAVERANDASGRRCLYFPHVAGPLPELRRQIALISHLGLKGALMCPVVMGLDNVRELAGQAGIAVMAHPALSGNFTNGGDQGIAHGLLLGTLFRLAGADISIFPNYGGRFSFTREQCLSIRDRLLQPLGDLPAALPCPAGGMRFDNVAAMAADYGEDSVVLVGGALQAHSKDLAAATRALLDRVREHFAERLTAPADAPPPEGQPLRTHLAFVGGANWQWQDREDRIYKESAELPFKGIRRVQLAGMNGERTAFDLRYFEVQPGGYSSLEKHLHTHVVIAARGRGLLLAGERRIALSPMDVAYIAPFEVHQLRCVGDEPFGFFCIVDHERDRPERP